MRVVFQRCTESSVYVAEKDYFAEIQKGAAVFLGIETDDTPEKLDKLAKKVAELRVFEDDKGKMNLSLLDISGGVLLIPNFTLCADTSHGRRPAFIGAARPDMANPFFERFAEKLEEYGVIKVKKGVFGADMQVKVVNDGPVTIVIDE